MSNLPSLSKILENVVSSQLCSFLEKHGEVFQSGFRPYHITETAFIRVTNYLLFIIDSINYNILLNRLENSVGISGSALAWFKSYLSDRHQFVAENEDHKCSMEYLKAQF